MASSEYKRESNSRPQPENGDTNMTSALSVAGMKA